MVVTKALKGKSLFMELYDVKRDLFSVKFFLSSFLSTEEKRMKHFGKEQKRKKEEKERERERETQTRANAREAKSSCCVLA